MKIYLSLLMLLLSMSLLSQDARIDQIQNQLDILIVDQPGLDDRIETSVSGVPLTEYIRSMGIQHELNINVQDGLTDKVINNFANARVSDVLVFLCREYSLTIDFIGDIMAVKRFVPEPEPEPVTRYVLPKVDYDDLTGFLSIDLKFDSLEAVAREITKNSPSNVVVGPGLDGKLINAFIQKRPMMDALEKMCFANNLQLKEEGSFFIIEAITEEEVAENKTGNGRGSNNGKNVNNKSTGLIDAFMTDSLITVTSDNASIADLISEVSSKMYKNYFVYSEPEGEISLFIENANYEQFLTYLFHGTDYSFIIQNDVYLIGSSQEDGITTTELIQLKHRTIENVFGGSGGSRSRGSTSSAGSSNSSSSSSSQTSSSSNRNRNSNFGSSGSNFSQDLSIQPFPELNAFIVTGSYPEVHKFKSFINQLDQVVPVVMIEVIIVDVNKNKILSAGVNAGLGENTGETTGSITGSQDGSSSGLNVNLSTESINELIGSLNGLGVVNLGNVSPDFYLNIQALESDGVLRTRSTPKIATLNSYTASLSIGQEEYFLQTSAVVNPSATNTVVTEQQEWKPLNADLSIAITPVVSGEGQVTLEILVTQSNFTERAGANGPFGSVNRNFESSIRVKDGEMILLGGLEDKSMNNSGEGLPGISRIPILRWFFGKRTKSKGESKLNIFIRPTIVY